MNRVYRLVWSRHSGALMPVAEHRHSHGKGAGRRLPVLGALALLGLAARAPAQEITLLYLQDSPAQSYTLYNYTFQAVLPQTYLTFQFRQDPDYWSLDDVSVTNPSNTQLLTNGNFEGGTTTVGSQLVPDGWTLIGQAGLEAGGTVASGCGLTGNNCYSDGAVGGIDGLYQSFTTVVGTTYTVSFDLANGGGVGTTEALVQVGASLDQGGTLVPQAPGSTNITAAGSPWLAAGLGTTLNPAFDGGTLQLDSSGPTYAENFSIDSNNGTIDNAGTNGTFTGVLSGPGGLSFVNSGSGGTVTLTAVNTYTGATSVASGATLALSGSGSIASSSGLTDNGIFDISGTSAGASLQSLSGSGSVTLGARTLTLTNASGSFSGGISGSGALAVSGGTETLSGANGYTGATSVASGATLALSGSGSIASSSGLTDNGTFDISGTSAGASLQSLSGSGSVTLGAQTLTLTNASGSFSGGISGSGALAVSGGSETLSGANGYTGATSVASGATLALSGSGSIASSSSVLDNGTLNISGTSAGASLQSLSGSLSGSLNLGARTLTLANASGTFAGAIFGNGGLVVSGGAETLSGTNTYIGATSVASGATLALSGSSSIANSSGLSDNGTFDISGTSAGASLQSLSGSGLVALGARTLTISGSISTFAGVIGGSGGLTLSDADQTLSGTNTYTGATNVASGATLALSGSGSIASSSGVVDNGALNISATSAGASVQSLSGGGNVTLGAQTLALSNASGTFAGAIAGSGALAVNGGTETLSGTNAFTGGLSVDGAQVSVGTDAALGGPAGTMTLNNGTLENSASFTTARNTVLAGAGSFDTDTGTTLTDNGNVAGAGALNKNGSGTLALCGNVSNAGGTTVSAGTLVICGTNSGAGAAAVASGATLALAGAGSLAASSVNDNGTLDISGSDAGSTLQSLSGGGSVTLGAQSLSLSNASGSFSGGIAGSGALVVNGGSESLSGSSSYSGGTRVTNATLAVASDASLGAASGGVTLNNATFENTTSFSTARTIQLAGADTFDTDAGTTLAQTGPIEGNGQVTKQGDGTLVLSGDNSGWGQQGNGSVGGLTVDAGLVEVTNAYGLGYGPVTVNGGVIATTVDILTGQTIQVSGNSTLNVEAGTTTTLTGTVETGGTGGCFDKTGAGTLVMSGSATLSNGTCVEQGRLDANGTLNSTVTVAAQGLLRGTGSINGAVTVSGTLAPGNSPGTLTTTASVTMEPGSTYQEDINGTGIGAGPGNYSRLLVTGANSQFIISGSTLDVNLVNITGTARYTPYVPEIGDAFRIITADGGIVGQFTGFSQPEGLAPGTELAVFYDPQGDNSIDVRVVPVSYASYVQSVGGNLNAQSAAGAVDQLVGAANTGHATPAQQALLLTLSGLSPSALQGVMTALAGEVHADLAAVAPQAGQWLDQAVVHQLQLGSGLEDGGAPQPGTAFWFDATAGHGEWQGDGSASGFATDHTQIAFGFDLITAPTLRAGIGFSHSLIDVEAPAGSGAVSEDTDFLYAQYALAPLLFDGLIGGGDTHWSTSRADPLGLTSSALITDVGGSSALASAGLRWPSYVGSMMFEPYGRVLWQRVMRGSFDEGSAEDALSGAAYEATGTRTLLGIAIGSAVRSPLAAPLTCQLDLGAGYDGGDLVRPTLGTTLLGADTTVVAPAIGRAFMQFALQGSARLAKYAYVYAGVTDESRGGISEQVGFNAGVRAEF